LQQIETFNIYEDGYPYAGANIIYDDTHIWTVASGIILETFDEVRITQIDPITNTIVDSISLPEEYYGYTLVSDFDGRYIWITYYYLGFVLKFDTITKTVTTTISLGATELISIYCDKSHNKVWVSSFGDKKVFVIDSITNEIVVTYDFDHNPTGINADNRNIWILFQNHEEEWIPPYEPGFSYIKLLPFV